MYMYMTCACTCYARAQIAGNPPRREQYGQMRSFVRFARRGIGATRAGRLSNSAILQASKVRLMRLRGRGEHTVMGAGPCVPHSGMVWDGRLTSVERRINNM